MLFRSAESLPVNVISNFITACAIFSSQIVTCEVVVLRMIKGSPLRKPLFLSVV